MNYLNNKGSKGFSIFLIVGLISTILAFTIHLSFDNRGIFLELWQLIFIASFSFSLLFTIAFYCLINRSITYALKIFITSLIITSTLYTSIGIILSLSPELMLVILIAIGLILSKKQSALNDTLKAFAVSFTTNILVFGVLISLILIIQYNGGEYNAEIEIKEIEDIGNGTYFEITDDELKEYPELIRSISGEGRTLSSDEFERLADFFDMKHAEYLFSIDMKFENNLNDNIIDAELMNTFESNEFPLSEKYSITTREKNSLYDSWFIKNKDNSPEYVIWEINDELKVYKSGYIEYQFTKIGEQYYEIQFVVT
jgi:hypothetical protein